MIHLCICEYPASAPPPRSCTSEGLLDSVSDFDIHYPVNADQRENLADILIGTNGHASLWVIVLSGFRNHEDLQL